MASTDARPLPLKNTAYRVYFPILDADGDPVASATGLDSEVSQDGGSMADCTNEATFITGSAGAYYLDLTAAEMNFDNVYIEVKTTSVGAKTTPITLYPADDTDMRVNVVDYLSSAAPALVGGRFDASVGAIAANVITATAINADAITAAKVADGTIDAATFAAGAINAAAIATDAITAAKVAADVGAEIAAAVRTELATELARIDAAITSRLATAGYATPDNATIAAIAAFVDTEIADIQARLPAALVAGRMDSSTGAMAANVLTASALAADAVDEILDDPVGDGAITLRQAIRVVMAGMAAKLGGAATTTVTIRNVADTQNVIVASVDANGNRTATTVTP